ncbi:c-type cytochrome biogenesis protein CcmI [Ruegeria sp. 2205SS24-7]|uniref:c-type cytochrome biogenesis protein CcmI n=1 Tax=Ruegeria discodermiae TaxID=3064389 RepID=UPI002740355B|nr:c-type cytochrome biogenesis protein CcmI [Ruegeria sp. 2205SS24-7]MDP5220110.1 c-type cytochrome biogenesis protein CcmI [Ruegeria sp. 2205SS24-7]
MTFWFIIIGIATLLALWTARPFLRNGQMELDDAEGAISVFRDQRDEVEQDHARGLITEAERDAAQREIEQRALKAARDLGAGMSMSRRSLPMALALVGVNVVASVAFYAALGTPEDSDQPLAIRQTEILERRASAGDINSRIQLLIQRTSELPESFETWWTLANSYSATGDHASAVDAYRRAVELGGDRPGILSAYGESMVLANGNKVPAAARVIFEQVLQTVDDPRARYYVALSKAQAQDFETALLDWTDLAFASAPDAPWLPLVRRDIVNMARFLKHDVRQYLPDATPTEIAAAGGSNASDLAVVRATELETALAVDPMDHQAWIELATIRTEQGDSAGAAQAITTAREHYAAAPFVQQKLDEAMRMLGLDLLRPDPAGPSAEQVAAVQNMDADEQADLISGMVEGLAARLKEEPDSPDDWIMLIRSYTVLGKDEKARASYETARARFSGNTQILIRLDTEVERHLGE